ncbi:MAG: single-stranded DNA-binding protein [Cellulomonadaceae bacterium]|jgi:single-strand DNA-binding protein|nr:single-stranded DNA-binding protein [Cellulomonadaceae bacterium]
MHEITIYGNVGNDPILYESSQTGTKWTSFAVASTPRYRNADGSWSGRDTMWFRVKAFGDRACHAVESLDKGTPVVVTGRLVQRDYVVTRQVDGVEVTEDRHDLEIEHARIAVDITRGVAKYTRVITSAAVPDGMTEFERSAASPPMTAVAGSNDDGSDSDGSDSDGDGGGSDGDGGLPGVAHLGGECAFSDDVDDDDEALLPLVA